MTREQKRAWTAEATVEQIVKQLLRAQTTLLDRYATIGQQIDANEDIKIAQEELVRRTER